MTCHNCKVTYRHWHLSSDRPL